MTRTEVARRRLEQPCGRDDAAIATVLAAIEDAMVDAGCPAGACAAVLVVAEEIVTNVARHAWSAGAVPGLFIVSAEIRQGADGTEVEVATEDDGIPFDPTARPEPDTDAPIEERAVGGLGIHLLMQMTERQSYHRAGGRNRFSVLWRRRAPPG